MNMDGRKQILKMTRRSVLQTAVAVLTIAVPTAMACVWSLYTDHSVRFNDFRRGRGFYRLLPLPIDYDARTKREITVAQEGESGLYSNEEDAYLAETSNGN